MKWLEVRIKTTEEAYDAISEMLGSIGAGGVVIEDPNDIRREIEKPNSLDYADDEFLASLGEDVTIKAYFSEDRSLDELLDTIKARIEFISGFLDTGEGLAGYSEIDEEDWATAWKKHYKPFHISDRIVIKPTWEQYDSVPGEIVIEMDPGMAFGTGTHETTRMCGKLLDRYLRKDDRIIDVGCGTGILSIMAVKLGSGPVTAVDVDEVAVRVTRENCRLNSVEGRVTAFRGELADVKKEKADLVVANIIADVIIGLAPQAGGYLRPGGLFLTSGIIKQRRDEVVKAFEAVDFRLADEITEGEWVAMVFRCPDSL